MNGSRSFPGPFMPASPDAPAKEHIMPASWSRQFVTDEGGATAIEYALLGALIAVVITGAVSVVGTEVHTLYQRVCTTVSSVMGGGAC